MNKLITILICFMLMIQSVMASVSPITIFNNAGSTKDEITNIQVPNYQGTATGLKTYYLEGFKGLLSNPGFEAISTWGSWSGTLSGSITRSTLTSGLPDSGTKGLRLTYSSLAMSVYQDSTIGATAYSGSNIQGVAGIYVKTSVTSTPLYVCPRQAGAYPTQISEPFCKKINPDGLWHFYDPYFILGGTSNGLGVTSNGVAISGNVDLDGAELKPSNIKSSGAAISPWYSYTPTFANMGTVTISSARWRQVGQNVEISIKGTTGTVVSATQSFTLPNSYTISTTYVSPQTVGRIARASASTTYFGSSVIATPSSNTLNFGSQASTLNEYTINTLSTFGSSEAFSLYASVQVNELQGTSVVVTGNNGDTDWAACNFSTLAWQGLGTVTNNLKCKRQGSDLLMTGYFTTGTAAASAAQIPMPLWNGVQLKTSSGLYPAGNTGVTVGKGNRTISSTTYFGGMTIVATSNNTYVSASCESSSVSGEASTTNGNSCFATGDQTSFYARVAVDGWQTGNFMSANISGLEQCADSYECENHYDLKVSPAGAVTDENLEWVTGNFSLATNIFTTTAFKTGLFTAIPTCQCTVQDSATSTFVRHCQITSVSTSGMSYMTTAHGTSTTSATPYGVNISCTKNPLDYHGKTAKAVASDQNIRTPGAINTVGFSFSFAGATSTTVCSTSPCPYLSQTGNNVSSVTRSSAGNYSAVLSRTFTRLSCIYGQVGAAAAGVILSSFCTNCNSIGIAARTVTTAAAQDVTADAICHGDY